MHPLASPLLYVCSLLLLLLLLYTKKVLLSSSETTTNNNSGWSTTVSSVARRPPLDFGGWSQSVFFQNVLLLPFAMTARRATILRREEAEREVASREEKRREDGFPVNRPRRLARAQTRPAFRVRRRHHPHGGGLFFFMRRRRRFCVRACKARSKIVRETSVCQISSNWKFLRKSLQKNVLDAT